LVASTLVMNIVSAGCGPELSSHSFENSQRKTILRAL
jgi:hypothetical protein